MVVLVPNAETDNLNLAAVFYTLQHAIFQHIMTFEVSCSQQTDIPDEIIFPSNPENRGWAFGSG